MHFCLKVVLCCKHSTTTTDDYKTNKAFANEWTGQQSQFITPYREVNFLRMIYAKCRDADGIDLPITSYDPDVYLSDVVDDGFKDAFDRFVPDRLRADDPALPEVAKADADFVVSQESPVD